MSKKSISPPRVSQVDSETINEKIDEKAGKEFYSPITDEVRKLRVSLNLTQKDFAERIGMTMVAYRAVENAGIFLRAHHIARICQEFKTPEFNKFIIKLFTGIDYNLNLRPISTAEKETLKELEDVKYQLQISERQRKLKDQMIEILEDEIKMLKSKQF